MMGGYMNSAKTTLWNTPQELFNQLNEEFHFTIDVCATAQNAKCERFFSPEQDGLKQIWTGVCWCNPPYGKGIADWVKKAATSKDATTVMLLPARTDTAWFHDYVLATGAEIRYIRRRLKYDDGKTDAPFPSMIVIFRKEKKNA